MHRSAWLAAAVLALSFGSSSAAEREPRMIVVAPEALASAVESFVAERNKTLATSLVTLEDALQRVISTPDPPRALLAKERRRGL